MILMGDTSPTRAEASANATMGSSSDVSSSVSARVREWAVAHATGGAQHNWLWREHVQLELLEVEATSGHQRGSGKARWTGSEQNGSAPRGGGLEALLFPPPAFAAVSLLPPPCEVGFPCNLIFFCWFFIFDFI